ncbi:MAG: protein-L-isoaspartate O-methyltransferase, partial [Nitrospinaceae bacterium]|nr:protein-L-isoaspartate O-methyltransferase [Nitrospinaceae bacterium]NIR57124.1 protein-L-isoaspartate O-methyltransferase [Nitrospinaceae bacterium]NIS87565.1 protein-L-isoaspartate O-methyltransferase [Nitrospinaceae bacterium]NIT84435.1 protein-L-isoaspartate O-methyltransferase [Nitrospinaceae bacterium]NIU46622.1 protein-L-isoaspartate O-methyltransferase [Nitrospinaceae bacterium]
MVRLIQAIARDAAPQVGKSSIDAKVLEALRTVPRHRFVPSGQRSLAYGNRPLPIGHGQTISQPYIVALMTDLLRPEPHHRVLEVGSGSGY